jgi:hypothetical protein
MPPSTDSISSSLQQLPHEVLVHVMRWLPQRDRVGACALTCRALLAAAGAATVRLDVMSLNQQGADAVAAWLGRHGSSHMEVLDLNGLNNGWPLYPSVEPPVLASLKLPCHSLRKLQSLWLQLLAVEPVAASSSQAQHTTEASCSSTNTSDHSSCCTDAALAELTALTHLSLQQCDVTHLGVGATQLSALSALQQLWMDEISADASVELTSPAYSTALGHTLGQLCQLTSLIIRATYHQPLLGTVVAAASQLSQLQHLELECVGTDGAVLVQDLPASWTSLEMQSCVLSSRSSSNGLHLQQLAALQHVKLDCTDVLGGALLLMPNVTALKCRPRTYQRMPNTLAARQHLQQLRRLELREVSNIASAADYAALTASSHLQALVLLDCDMAATAAEHIFAAGRSLPHLTELCISPDRFWPAMADLADAWLEHAADLRDCSLVVGPAVVGRLVACCPALHGLGTLVLEEGVVASDLAPLLQLTALSWLDIGGPGCDNAATQVLAAMTGEVKLKCAPLVNNLMR